MDIQTRKLSSKGIPIAGSEFIDIARNYFNNKKGKISYYVPGITYESPFSNKYIINKQVYRAENNANDLNIHTLDQISCNTLLGRIIEEDSNNETIIKNAFGDNVNELTGFTHNLNEIYLSHINKNIKIGSNICINKPNNEYWIGNVTNMMEINLKYESIKLSFPIVDVSWFQLAPKNDLFVKKLHPLIRFEPYFSNKHTKRYSKGINAIKIYITPKSNSNVERETHYISVTSIDCIPHMIQILKTDYYILQLNKKSMHRHLLYKGLFEDKVFVKHLHWLLHW